MPIRNDGTGKRWVELDLLVPGTPEQVWEAMATGAGNEAWFVKGDIEPREGGVFTLDFGEGMTTSGEVTIWDPPYRFGYVERDWEAGAPPLATEITITGRGGDRCVVRMVHSLFTSSDEWDDQIEGFETGWPAYFAVLRSYLAHFTGLNAASFMAMVPTVEDSLSAWMRLAEPLGLAGANVGERRSGAASSPEVWSGIVEKVYQDGRQRYVAFRLHEPGQGIAVVGTHEKGATSHSAAGPRTSVSVSRYFYGGDEVAVAAEASRARWQIWLADTFGGREEEAG